MEPIDDHGRDVQRFREASVVEADVDDAKMALATSTGLSTLVLCFHIVLAATPWPVRALTEIASPTRGCTPMGCTSSCVHEPFAATQACGASAGVAAGLLLLLTLRNYVAGSKATAIGQLVTALAFVVFEVAAMLTAARCGRAAVGSAFVVACCACAAAVVVFASTARALAVDVATPSGRFGARGGVLAAVAVVSLFSASASARGFVPCAPRCGMFHCCSQATAVHHCSVHAANLACASVALAAAFALLAIGHTSRKALAVLGGCGAACACAQSALWQQQSGRPTWVLRLSWSSAALWVVVVGFCVTSAARKASRAHAA